MTLNKVSIKNFISDLPRLLNENFNAISEVISRFYDEDTRKVTANNMEVSGNITTNSLTTNSANFRLSNGSTITIEEILTRLSNLENNQ